MPHDMSHACQCLSSAVIRQHHDKYSVLTQTFAAMIDNCRRFVAQLTVYPAHSVEAFAA